MEHAPEHEITKLVRVIYNASDKRDELNRQIQKAKARLFRLCPRGQYDWGKIGEVKGKKILVKEHYRQSFKYLRRNKKWF